MNAIKDKLQFVFVDVEAAGNTPFSGKMTEFGAVKLRPNGPQFCKPEERETFYGKLYNFVPHEENPAIPVPVGDQLVSFDEIMTDLKVWLDETADRHVFVSDNPSYDFMWIADAFDRAGMRNPFGYSGRRLGDMYAGAKKNLKKASEWKRYRKTVHDHNPVNDAVGNVEAFERFYGNLNLTGGPF